MHLIRRSATRAISSPSTSLLTKSRSITTLSPFIRTQRPAVQSAIRSAVFKRFASDDSSESSTSSSISSAISSATESVASYAGDAAASLTRNSLDAKNGVVDNVPGEYAFPSLGNRDAGEVGRSPRAPVAVSPSNALYIGNLAFEVTDASLMKEFEPHGATKAFVVSDSRGLSKGFGYCEFGSVEEATKAIEIYNQSVFEGRRIVVNYQANKRKVHDTPNPPSRTLFIGNLAFEMSDADLNKLFRDIRNVIDVRVAIDRRTGQPRGFAHADFIDVDSAQKAMEVLQNKDVYGRTLRVDFSSSGPRKASSE